MLELYIPSIFLFISFSALALAYTQKIFSSRKFYWFNLFAAWAALFIQYSIVQPYKAISPGIDLTHPSTILLVLFILGSVWISLRTFLPSDNLPSIFAKYICALGGLFLFHSFFSPMIEMTLFIFSGDDLSLMDMLELAPILMAPSLPALVITPFIVSRVRARMLSQTTALNIILAITTLLAVLELVATGYYFSGPEALAIPFLWAFIIVGHLCVAAIGLGLARMSVK